MDFSRKTTFLLLTLLLSVTCIYGQAEFITKWKTDNPGASCDACIEIPTQGSGYKLNLEYLPEGFYVLQLIFNNKIESVKFLKM